MNRVGVLRAVNDFDIWAHADELKEAFSYGLQVGKCLEGVRQITAMFGDSGQPNFGRRVEEQNDIWFWSDFKHLRE